MLATKCRGLSEGSPEGECGHCGDLLLTKAKCLRLLPWSARLHEAVLRNISCRRWQQKLFVGGGSSLRKPTLFPGQVGNAVAPSVLVREQVNNFLAWSSRHG